MNSPFHLLPNIFWRRSPNQIQVDRLESIFVGLNHGPNSALRIFEQILSIVRRKILSRKIDRHNSNEESDR